MGKLTNRTTLITGAGRGIGRATALLFAAEGADLILVSRTEKELSETAHLCERKGAEVLWRPLDISDLGEIDRLFEEIVKRGSGVDILINNAAMFDKGLMADYPVERFRAMLETNLIAPYYLSQKVLPLMHERRGGAIVNISSLSGYTGAEKFPTFGAYNISKYGLWGLTEILALEGRERNVRVNQLTLSGVDTAMFSKAVPPGVEADLTPEDVAHKILYLASDDSGSLTGENLLLLEKPTE
jgi:3-oxoacyl-[acyl-carrier protein] reductase